MILPKLMFQYDHIDISQLAVNIHVWDFIFQHLPWGPRCTTLPAPYKFVADHPTVASLD
jgi:hypothetical protein